MDIVPAEMQGRLISGMRWNLWLSVVTVPFSYGKRMLLASERAEVIGTYGLLSVYIGVVSTLLYLGNGSVVIRFLPLVEAVKRSACSITSPWAFRAVSLGSQFAQFFIAGNYEKVLWFVVYLSMCMPALLPPRARAGKACQEERSAHEVHPHKEQFALSR